MNDDPLLVYELINVSKRLKAMIQASSQTEDKAIPYELLSHLNREGKTLKDLSKLLRCSKQEVTRQIQRATDNEWVVIKPDPNDGRSKRVYVSSIGNRRLKEGLSFYQQIEDDWKQQLGEKKVEVFKEVLLEVANLLPEDPR